MSWDWIILLCGALLASTLSGTFGVGGGSLLLVLLARTLGPVAAVPVLTVTQLMANTSRAALGWRDLRWREAGWFVLGALPGVAAGTWLFSRMDSDGVARTAGAVLLVAIVVKSFIPRDWKPPLPLVGLLTGGLSAVAGIAGPFTALAFWQLGLPPLAFIATEALAVGGVHLAKIIAYGRWNLLNETTLTYGLALGGVSMLGSWLGRKLAGRIPALWFRRGVMVFLVLAALQLIWQGSR